jgi:hypothetical protein
MSLLVVLLLLLSANPANAETLHLSVAVAPEAVNALPGMPALQAGVQRIFTTEFGVLASLAFDDDQAGPASEPSARLLIGATGGNLTISTDLTRAHATRSLVSSVPAGSPSSLLATIAGDLAFLYVSSRGFSTLPLSPPPALVASLATDTLGAFTGWNLDELEPVGIASSGDEITICFPHRYLTLGPLFRVTTSTIRDINGQSVGREPLQLSRVIRGSGDRLLLLSERQARVALVDPRLGTRKVAEAPGLSALPARLIGGTVMAALPGRLGQPGVTLYPLDGGHPQVVRVAASYVPAFDLDREGNLWAWDAGERRVRILTPRGQEIFSIRPLFSAATMPLPQQLAVFDDGSFLLAGSAEVWKFQSSGVPVWRLSRIPGRPGESLPASFDLAANRADGSLTIMDAQSRRLLSFSASPAGAAARLGTLFGRLDSRKAADLQGLSAFTRAGGLGLMALQFGEQLARAGGPETEREAARAALLGEKAAAYTEFADGLTRDLLYERADGAWLRTGETLRELAAESPEDDAAAGMLQTVLTRRREVRAALSGPTEIQQESARVVLGHPGGCGTTYSLEVTLRNSGTQAMRDVRIHASIPAAVSTPALAVIDEILPSKERAARIPFGFSGEGVAAEGAVQVFAMVTYERGQEGVSRSFTFSAPTVGEGSPGTLAEILACRAVPQDTLAASLPETLLSGGRPVPAQPLVELAGTLDCLGRARRAQDTVGSSRAAILPATSDFPKPLMRNLLRTLATEESEWTVVTASVASSLGVQAAVLSVRDRSFALVDTGIPFFDAIAAVPGLEGFRQTLAALSPGGTLWLPLSGRVPKAGVNAAVWAVADALDALAGMDITSAQRASVPAFEVQQSAPNPFPLVLPAIATRPSITALRAAMTSSLPGTRPQ